MYSQCILSFKGESLLGVPDNSKIAQRRLSTSVRRGELSAKRALQAARWVDKEVNESDRLSLTGFKHEEFDCCLLI